MLQNSTIVKDKNIRYIIKSLQFDRYGSKSHALYFMSYLHRVLFGSSDILRFYSYDFHLSLSILCFAFILKSIILSVPVVTHPKSPSVLCLHVFHVIFNNLLTRPLLKSSPSHLLPFIITRTPPLDSPSSVLRHYDFNFGCFIDLPLFFLFLLFFMKLFPPLVLYDQH